MNLPSQNSPYSTLLGRPWLKAATMMHDWKNNTLLLQSRGSAVKVNLKDGKVRQIIPRGSKPSSLASKTTHTFVDSQLSSELSSNYVMNWIESLATIDSMMMGISKPLEEIDKVTTSSIDHKDEEIPYLETPEEMLKIFRADELKKEHEERELLHLCYLVEPENSVEETLRK